MKLVIVTSVEEYHDDILEIFKKSNIQNFSESEIDGYKNTPAILSTSNWFAANKSVTNSIMLFSFTETVGRPRLRVPSAARKRTAKG